jgi:O-antigen biosynthesis protein
MSPDDQAPPAVVNSRAWWEENFRLNWDVNHGSAQTAHFMDRLVAGLVRLDREFQYLSTHPLEVLDWGCAFGQGAQRLSEAFPSCRVTGLDFAEEAVRTARLRYPAVEFLQAEGDRLPRDFDVIVTSNCLEHFDDPLAIARDHLRACRKLYIALVPYREGPVLIDCHAVRFDDDTFPVRLDGFLRVAAETVQVDPVFWNGLQLLVVYASPAYFAEVDVLGGADLPTDRAAWAMYVEEQRVERDLLKKAHAAREAELNVVLEERARVIAEWNARHDELSRRHADLSSRHVALCTSDAELCTSHAELSSRHVELSSRHVELSSRHVELSSRHVELSTRYAHDRDQDRLAREEFQERIRVLLREVEELRQWSHTQGEQLAEIMGGFSWKVLQRLWRIRQKVAPHGSRMSRAGQLGLRGARKLRQGPGPFARAVFRRLAATLQRRVKALVRRSPGVPAPRFGAPGLVSVVLPVYNQAYLLASAIESVLNQTYPDFELIVVNDGSADDVEAVLARYVGHPRVRLLTQGNQKLPKALSNGFEYARGEFWTWTSADNLMHPEQLARQVAFLRANPDTAMVYADYLAIDDRGAPLRDPSFRAPNRRTPDAPEIHLPRTTEILNTVNDNFIGPCFMYRGWVGRLLGEYDPEFLGVEDWDYWMRINDLFRIAHLGSDETLYQYRVHDNSISGRAVELRIAERALRLLEHERDRAAALGAPWTVRTDAALRARMGDAPADGTPLLPWPGGDAGDDEKTLYLVDAGSLPGLSTRQGAAVAAWFDGPDAAYAHHVEAARLGCLGFARDAGTAARLEMLGIEAIVAALDGTLPVLALEHARHRRFQESVRRPGAARALPAPFRAADKPLHVLIQVDDFLYGGLENAALGVASGLDPARFRVTLLVLGRQGSAVERARALGVRVVTLPEPYHEGHYRRLLADESVDVVNAHYSLFGAAVAGAVGLPFVQVVQNTYVWFGPQEIAAHRAADAHTTAYVCVSAAAARLLDRRVGLPPSKMIVLPNGLDVAAMDAAHAAPGGPLRRELGLARDDFVFLNVSQVAPTKAQVPIVQALAEVLRTHPRAKVVMVGQGHDQGYLDWLDQEIARHGLERSVVRTGPRDDAARFYWMADAFLLPSFWEGWSLALNEAVYAGLPVVASDVGGARDLLSRVGGRLIRPPVDPLDIDPARFTEVSLGHHPGFVADMAGAMRATCDDPGRTILAPDVLWFLDRDRIHAVFADLFSWLAQGGRPDAARAWAAVGEAGRPAARDGHRASAA